MPFDTLKPTETVTPYAQNHQLKFSPNDILPSLEDNIQTRKLNWFAKSVQKVNKSAPGIVKFLLGLTLVASVIGIPVLILWIRESHLSNQDKKIRETALNALNMNARLVNKRAEVLENLGLQNFENLPILDLKGRTGSTGYLDFLKPEDLTAPIMKGTDKVGRPFISLKLLDRETSKPFVITLFQRYSGNENPLWVYVGGEDRPASFYDSLDSVATIGVAQEAVFNQIIEGNHPKFSLANMV